MSYCAAINCRNKVGVTPGKTFHRFPTWNRALLDAWAPVIQPGKYTDNDVICSDHFVESCFDKIGDVKHIRADAVPTIITVPTFIPVPSIIPVPSVTIDDRPPDENCDQSSVNPQITKVVSLAVKTETDPLNEFHQQIEKACEKKEELQKKAERRKIMLQMLLSFKRFSINQQKIKIVLNRSRILRRKMMQTAMVLTLLTLDLKKIKS